LAPLTASESLVVAINEALQFSPIGARTTADIQQKLLDYLSGQQLLLVMDNFEHVVEQSELMADILTAAPQVKILATSREVLSLVEEWSYPIESLPVPDKPDADDFEGYSSVQLFAQCARRVRPGFVPQAERECVVQICQLVDGMPLGIELAAAWLRQLPCATIAAEIGRNYDFLTSRLRNVTTRHRSLRAVFDYSWALLNEEQRETLSRLSVFRGGFSVQAADYVAGAQVGMLLDLEDKSLVRGEGDGRYSLHELVRYYAAEKLVDGRETETYDHHCQFFARWLAEQEPQLHKSERADFGDELENIRHALQWALEQREFEQVGHVIGSLALYYSEQGRYVEAKEVLEQVIRVVSEEPASDSSREQVLAKALAYQGRAALFLGQYEVAADRLSQSLSLFRPEQNHFVVAWTQSSLAMAYGWLGKHEEAHLYHQQALEGAVALGAQRLVAEINNSLGASAYMAGRYAEAQQYFQTCLDTYRAIGAQRSQAGALLNLADVCMKLGDYRTAQQLLEECVEVCQETNHRYVMGMAYSSLGDIYLSWREHSQARQLFQESLNLHMQLNNQAGISAALNGLGSAALHTGELEAAEEFFSKSLKAAQATGSQFHICGVMYHLGQVAIRQGRETEAKAWFYQALHIGQESKQTPLVLAILLVVTKLLMGKDENKLAMCLLTVIAAHPAAEQETRQEAADLLREWNEAVPTTDEETSRWPTNLDELVKEALDWLEAEEQEP
jgi:predicted ATPase/Tfp pilus assembly protein PilF